MYNVHVLNIRGIIQFVVASSTRAACACGIRKISTPFDWIGHFGSKSWSSMLMWQYKYASNDVGLIWVSKMPRPSANVLLFMSRRFHRCQTNSSFGMLNTEKRYLSKVKSVNPSRKIVRIDINSHRSNDAPLKMQSWFSQSETMCTNLPMQQHSFITRKGHEDRETSLISVFMHQSYSSHDAVDFRAKKTSV